MIFQTEGYCLGDDVHGKNYKSFGDALGEILFKLRNDDAYRVDISNQCFRYVKKHHQISEVTKSLINISERSTARLSDLFKYSIRYSKLFPLLKKCLVLGQSDLV